MTNILLTYGIDRRALIRPINFSYVFFQKLMKNGVFMYRKLVIKYKFEHQMENGKFKYYYLWTTLIDADLHKEYTRFGSPRRRFNPTGGST
jgi:hypothetical protein